MTIREKIIESEIKMLVERIKQYKSIDGPECVIKKMEADIVDLQSGKIKIGGSKELLDIEWNGENVTVSKAFGGKLKIQYNGFINYYPHARYGRFITEDC